MNPLVIAGWNVPLASGLSFRLYAFITFKVVSSHYFGRLGDFTKLNMTFAVLACEMTCGRDSWPFAFLKRVFFVQNVIVRRLLSDTCNLFSFRFMRRGLHLGDNACKSHPTFCFQSAFMREQVCYLRL